MQRHRVACRRRTHGAGTPVWLRVVTLAREQARPNIVLPNGPVLRTSLFRRETDSEGPD